jgi:hypothetical protein
LQQGANIPSNRFHKAGGCRKTPENSETATVLQTVVFVYQAGTPTNSAVYRVNISPSKTCQKMRELSESGF